MAQAVVASVSEACVDEVSEDLAMICILLSQNCAEVGALVTCTPFIRCHQNARAILLLFSKCGSLNL